MSPIPAGMIGVITAAQAITAVVKLREVAADHLGAEHLRLHRRLGIGRSREPAHQRREHDVGLRAPAHGVADQSIGKAHQPPRDASAVHDRATEDEERHCEQRETVGRGDDALGQDLGGQSFRGDEECKRGAADCEGHRHVQREQAEHTQTGRRVRPLTPHPPGRVRIDTAIRTAISAKPVSGAM